MDAMTKVERTACRAAELIPAHPAAEAWYLAAVDVYGDASSVVRKVCPREAFVALCDAGLLPGSRAEPGITLGLNRSYALAIVGLLRQNPALAQARKTFLWRQVMAVTGSNTDKMHNGQIDVVLGLWKAGLVH
jgi:hypothetical protein